MNVDFEDPSQLKELAKFSLIFVKKESTRKKSQKATDTQIPIYTMIRLKAGHVSGKHVFFCSTHCLWVNFFMYLQKQVLAKIVLELN